MKWTVIICTHNRARDLRVTLPSVARLDNPAGGFEILIVDNASQDETRSVAEVAAAQSPNMRYFREEKVGLSHARNTGIKHAQGEFIAFLDDDAAPEPDWLEKLEVCFKDPQVVCVGGMVKPVWQNLPDWPDWLHSRLTGYYTVIDYPDFRYLRYPFCPAGTNVAFRKSVFKEIGNFNPQLGRAGTSLLSCEEADLCVAINKAGYQILYTPEALVHHRVHENRLKQDWLLQRSYWAGVSSAILERQRFGTTNCLIKTGKYLFLIPISELLKWMFTLIKNRKQAFFWECQALFSKAFLKNLWFNRI